MQNTREQFLAVFQEEWKMFVAGEKIGDVATAEKREGNFDVPVKVGELRIFADYERPLVGLLYKQVDDAWIVIPVSDFSVPATEQEILIGRRVYQLWNSFTVQSAFVERSWVVDEVALPDRKDLNAALLHVMVGDSISDDLANCMGLPILSLEDPRLEYEREFVARVVESDKCRTPEMRIIGAGLTDSEKKQIWDAYRLDEYAFAAATQERFPEVMLIDDRASWKGECRLVSQFSGYYEGDEPKLMKFRLDDPHVKELVASGSVAVDVYKRSTKELVGHGALTEENGEIVARVKVGGTDQEVRIETAAEIVLILTK